MEKQKHHSEPVESAVGRLFSWPTKKKIGLVLILCIGFAAFALLIHLYRASGYQLLYGSLSSHELATLSRWLDSRNIDYKTDHERGDLFVSSGRVHTVRSEIAEQQLWKYPETGHELVDADRLAPLESLDENTYTTALQRELARTIEAFDQVQSARLHLSSSHRGTATAGTRRATIILTLEPGSKPPPNQLQAMSRLVSGAVADISPGRIRIISSTGTILLRGSGYAGDNLYGADTLSYQRNVEEMLENRALEVIEMLIGNGPVHVAVTADINFANSETISERFDPEDPVVRKEESSQLISDANASSPGPPAAPQDAYSGSVNSESKLEYEINKTISKIEEPAGTIERLTVTMLLPEKKRQYSDSGSSYLPLSSEEIDRIREAVSAVLSLKPERGDAIYLSSMPMVGSSGAESEVSGALSGIDFFAYLPLARIMLFVAGFLLIYVFFVRPILAILRQEDIRQVDSESKQEPLPENEPVQKTEDLFHTVKQEILSDPTPAAHIVRKWIQDT